MKPFAAGTGTRSRWVAFLATCRRWLCGVHCVKITPWRGNPLGGGGGHAMVAACGCHHQQITLGQVQLIKVSLAHLTARKARLDCDPVFRQQHKESGKMAARHVAMTKGQHKGVSRSIGMVKMVSGILRHNHWG